jgi:hypothetical protein
MATAKNSAELSPTLEVEAFWKWLTVHPNCILRAGTATTVLYDDDDLHWQLAADDPETYLVQVIRGKRLAGEILIARDPISYVQSSAGEQDGEFVFELVVESESEHATAYFFVVAHSYEVEEAETSGRVH